MFYSTACYGALHARDMVDAGFSVASGAAAVNTNSALEYPRFLSHWGAMLPFDVCVRRTYAKSRATVTDGVASRTLDKSRFDRVDSAKVLFGDTSINIRSDGD